MDYIVIPSDKESMGKLSLGNTTLVPYLSELFGKTPHPHFREYECSCLFPPPVLTTEV